MSGTPIALLTDYGQRDAYAGILRAVILDIWPFATLFDITHDVPPQNLWSASWLLASALPVLPHRCIVCAVVDPGVGSERRSVAVETRSGLRVVAPDNGMLELLLRRDPASRVVVLDQERWFLPNRSATFDGRDVFAPIAGQLARGVRMAALGTEVDPASLVSLQVPQPEFGDASARAPVVHIDRFGNAITSLELGELRARLLGGGEGRAALRVTRCGLVYPFVRTFSEVAVGERLSYVGSVNALELAVRDGDCAHADGIAQGDWVEVHTRA